MNSKAIFNKLIDTLILRSKKLTQGDIENYQKELENFYAAMAKLSEKGSIETLVKELGFEEVAKQFFRLNSYYKSHYSKIIGTLNRSLDTPKSVRLYAQRADMQWQKQYKEAILYLSDLKSKMNDEPDLFSEDVKYYKGNSFYEPGYELPSRRKKNLNDDVDNILPWDKDPDGVIDLDTPWFVDDQDDKDVNEGLRGITAGAISGATLALVIYSLSATFRTPPKLLIGVSTALGAMIGQFVQKHFFIDFTNYNKVKRYVSDFPESYDYILEIMAKNASKFQQKDPKKYKQILANLNRLQKNPPSQLQPSVLDEPDEEDEETDPFNYRNVQRREDARKNYDSLDWKLDQIAKKNNKSYDVKDLHGAQDEDSEKLFNDILKGI